MRFQFFALMVVFGVLGVIPDPGGPGIAHGDHLLHLVGWFVGGVSARLAYPMARPALTGLNLWLYSLVIELVQIAVPTRSFEFADLVSNAVGIAVGLFVGLYFVSRRA